MLTWFVQVPSHHLTPEVASHAVDGGDPEIDRLPARVLARGRPSFGQRLKRLVDGDQGGLLETRDGHERHVGHVTLRPAVCNLVADVGARLAVD